MDYFGLQMQGYLCILYLPCVVNSGVCVYVLLSMRTDVDNEPCMDKVYVCMGVSITWYLQYVQDFEIYFQHIE